MNPLLFGKMDFYKHIENKGTVERQKTYFFFFNSCLCSVKETWFPEAQEGRLTLQQGAEG